MENTKRVRARAIIFDGEKLVSMYRERDGRIFYTFPGGGIEANETLTDCVKREVLEEFGLTVEDEDVNHLRTVGDIVKYCESKVK